jgi:hypothetical protein
MSRLCLIRCRFVISSALALSCCLLLSPVRGHGAEPNAEATGLARQILDDGRPEAERKKIIAEHPALSFALLQALVSDLPKNDLKEEYRRIPWIWRVTVAAAKRNDLTEMKPIVDFSIPQADKPLRDWQAVVLGGGIVNGTGLVGAWPDERMEKMVSDDAALRSRWERTLNLASAMADDPAIFNGTRYDALRIIGVDSWDKRGAQLCRYLKKGKGIDDELVQGAIGGLGTMRSPRVAEAIVAEFPQYNRENRGFALDALLKDPQRMSVLLDAIEAGAVKRGDLSPARAEKLKKSADRSIRKRARKILAASRS